MQQAKQTKAAAVPQSALLQMLQQGIDLQRAGQLREAEQFYRRVLYHKPDSPEAMNLLGTLAMEAGDDGFAADCFEKAVKTRPKDPAMRHNFGSALKNLNQHEEAIVQFRKALDVKPGQVESLILIGICYNQTSHAEEGLPFLQKALRLQPENTEAKIAMAECLINLGKMDAAEALIKECISKGASKAKAYQSLSALKKYTADAPELKAVLTELQSDEYSEVQHIPLHYAAAKMSNDAKLYAQTMHHYKAAKENQARRYDIAAYERRVEQFSQLFDPLFLQSRKHFGDPSAKPVFIVGMPRSGTTLTEQIVSSHPVVTGAGELGEMTAIARDLGDNSKSLSRFVEKLQTMDVKQSQDLAQRYLKRIARYSRDAERITDKMPHNFEYVGLITLLFPNATIIHCTRDAIDNCLSCYMNAFSDSHSYNADLGKLGLYYRAYHRLMGHWNKVLPGRILENNYEALIEDQEGRSRALINHCKLPWDDACLNYQNNDRTVTTISRWQVRQPIYKTSVKRWKPYEKDLGELITALGNLAQL